MHASIIKFLKALAVICCLGLCVLAAVYVYAGTITGSASLTVGTPSPTPANTLQTNMNQWLADTVGGGQTTAPASMCANGATPPTCTTAGSVNTGLTPGTNITTALNNDLVTGDVSLATGNYTISGNITIPTLRMLHCQNGASLTGTGQQIIMSAGYNFLVNCVLTNLQVTVSGTDTTVSGNTITGPSSVAGIAVGSGSVTAVVNFNQLTGNTGITDAGDTDQIKLNEISGSMFANNASTQTNIPRPGTLTGGTTVVNDMWAVLGLLQPGAAGNNGYSTRTAIGGGSDDSANVESSLSGSTSGAGLYLTSSLYTFNSINTVIMTGGRNLICAPGTKLTFTVLNSGQGNNFLQWGDGNGGTTGNQMIIGCEITGLAGKCNLDPLSSTTGPYNIAWSQYYNDLFRIAGDQHAANILIAGDDIHDGCGDNIITYCPLGASLCVDDTNTWPKGVTIMGNYMHHAQAQAEIHQNGGIDIHIIMNHLRDGSINFEEDGGAEQHETGNAQYNLMDGTQNNIIDYSGGPTPGCYSYQHSCTAQSTAKSLVGCFYTNNKFDGGGLSCAPPTLTLWAWTTNGGVNGNYNNNIMTNSATTSTGTGSVCSPCQGTYNFGG